MLSILATMTELPVSRGMEVLPPRNFDAFFVLIGLLSIAIPLMWIALGLSRRSRVRRRQKPDHGVRLESPGSDPTDAVQDNKAIFTDQWRRFNRFRWPVCVSHLVALALFLASASYFTTKHAYVARGPEMKLLIPLQSHDEFTVDECQVKCFWGKTDVSHRISDDGDQGIMLFRNRQKNNIEISIAGYVFRGGGTEWKLLWMFDMYCSMGEFKLNLVQDDTQKAVVLQNLRKQEPVGCSPFTIRGHTFSLPVYVWSLDDNQSR